MHEKSEFYTLKGYQLKNKTNLTESMEDYLEMIYRSTTTSKTVHIKDLSIKLNVKPSSVSKMITKLKIYNLVYFEKYGVISLTDKGKKMGKYLLWRHNILVSFFKKLNKKNYSLEQVEKIEHFIDYETLKNMLTYLSSSWTMLYIQE